MSIEMKMPRLSDTMEVGTVVKWNVKPGQKVSSGDVVADIETDKATMELQTFDDGTVATLAVEEGKTVPVGTTIMLLAESGEDLEQVKAGGARQGDAPAQKQASAPEKANGHDAEKRPRDTSPGLETHANESSREHDRVFASPLARKIAEESGVDLASIEGTGPGGRIVRKDVESAVGSAPGGSAVGGRAERGRGTPSWPTPDSERRATKPAPLPMPGAGGLPAKTVPLSNMRQTIAKRLVQSKATVPHYQVTVAVRMDALLNLRAQLNDQLAGQGVKLSVNDFLVRACALAMHQHPFVNSRWNEGNGGNGASVQINPDINIGVAIALPINPETLAGGGLVVATLRHADRLGLRQISSESKRLSEKARAKGLTIDEMADSTFTISNLGMFGVEHFTAIINPPNTAILAVGAAVEKPVVETDAKTGAKSLVIGHEMQMTMSSDHRVIDGAMAAQYLATVKELLEKPATLLV